MTDRAARPHLVFLHGWTMDGSIFDKTIAALDDRYRCRAPTLPGHGKDALSARPNVDGAAHALHHYLNEQQVSKPVLVGWSLGAMVAWRLLERAPELPVAGLVVIDMSPKIVNDPHWAAGIRGFEDRNNVNALKAMQADWQSYARRIVGGMFARGDERAHEDTLAIIRSRDPEAMIRMWESLTEADAREVVKTSGVPTLIIKGARSRIYPGETGRWILDHAPDAQLVTFAQSGHSPHLEEPRQFVEVLDRWIAGLEAPRH